MRKKNINTITDLFDDECSLCGTVEFNLVSRSCHTGCIPAGTALLSLNSECCLLLNIAACHNNLGYAQMLVDNCPPDKSLTLNQNPLQMAALRGYFEMVQLLLTHDTTDINRKDSEDNTALSLAILHNHEQTASWLIQKGADIHAANQWLQQPIHYASYQGMNELLLLLLEKGADTAAQSSELETPLHFAFYGGGNLECAKTLLKNNAPLNTKNNKGQTPLHSCIMHSKEHQTLVLELIAAGALMNEADKDGNTPLHLALLTRSPECIDTLITRGARTDIPNFAGQTALQLLEARGQL